MFEVDADGFEAELTQRWTAARAILRQRLARAVGLGITLGAAEIRRSHRYKNRTGVLEKSTVGEIEGWRGEEFVGRIRASAPYASFVEYDTAPHPIFGNPWLVFRWKGVLCHFRYVNHPGTTGQPFMHFGYYKAERVIEAETEKAFVAMQEFLDR
jgi:hypothetical protein